MPGYIYVGFFVAALAGWLFYLLVLRKPRTKPEVAPAFKAAILRAISEAKRLQQAKVGTEHLFLELLETSECRAVLEECGVQLDALKHRLVALRDAPGERGTGEPQPTPEIQQAISQATVWALSQGRNSVDCTDALVALCQKSSLLEPGLARAVQDAATRRETA